MSGLMHVFGFTEYVVRAPSLIALCLTALFSFFFTRKWIGTVAAALGAFILLTFADLIFYGAHYAGEIDIFFAFLVFLQVMVVFIFHQKEQHLFLFAASYSIAAIGLLTKGMPAIAFQVLTMVAYAFWSKKWIRMFSWQHACGILLFLLICGSYFYQYSQREDLELFLVNLYKEAAQRSGLESKWMGLLSGVAAFPFTLLKVLLPWSLFAFLFLKKELRRKAMVHPLISFILFFLFFNIPLYWFTGDLRIRYIYPFFPFFAILLAFAFTSVVDEKSRIRSIIEKVLSVALLILPIACLAVLFSGRVRELPGAIAICISLAVVLASLSLNKVKNSLHLIWRLVFAIVILKIGMNFVYLPFEQVYSDRTILRDHVWEMHKITGDQPIHLTGDIYFFERDLSVGSWHIRSVQLATAPPVSFHIPYNYNRANGHLMNFEQDLEIGECYLASTYHLTKHDLWKKVEPLYEFHNPSNEEDFVLFKAKVQWNGQDR
jgi:4-amino-4-deoxy-L-arabinose transferase-like glycosyltransferase